MKWSFGGFLVQGSDRTRGYGTQFDITMKRVTANGKDVSIITRFQAADPNRRESQDRIECATNGQLEEEIFAGVDSVVASRK